MRAPPKGLRSVRALLGARGDRGVAVAVLGEGLFGVARIDRHLLAVGDSLDTVGGHAEAGQEVLDRVGATTAEGEVVFARAAFVGVAFDAHLHARIAYQPG